MSRCRRSEVFALLLVGACSGDIVNTANQGEPSAPAEPAAPSAPAGPAAPPSAEPGACKLAAWPRARAWRLSHGQLKNTLADVFGTAGSAVDGLPPDARLEGFGNRADKLGLSQILLEHYFRIGDEMGAEVVRRAGEFLKCPMGALGEGACLGEFLRTVAARAWRRPLAGEEEKALAEVYATAAKAEGPEVGLRSVVSAIVVSPNFLFRTELGAPDASGENVRLTDHEIAAALSYMLWDAPPDARLTELAAAGKLRDPAAIAAEARRLLAGSKRASDALNTFLRQWLKIDDLPGKNKDAALFPFYSTAVGADLLEETRRLLDDVVFAPGGDRSLRTLFTTTRGYASARTAVIYGVNAPGAELAPVELDQGKRRGLLTSGAFLAGHASIDVTKVVDRGAFVREEFLCAPVPAPPQMFRFEDAAITEDMTAREKLLIHAKNPACASCHAQFDGIGFALENYDAVGRYRETEKGKKIDPSGTLPLPQGGEIKFANFVDLMDQLAARPDLYRCFAGQYLSYATGRGLHELDACEASTLAERFAKSGHRIDELVIGIVSAPAFSTRSK